MEIIILTYIVAIILHIVAYKLKVLGMDEFFIFLILMVFPVVNVLFGLLMILTYFVAQRKDSNQDPFGF